jgi:hypothetical protein
MSGVCPICQEKIFILPGIDNRGYKYDHKTKKIYHLSCWTQQQNHIKGHTSQHSQKN